MRYRGRVDQNQKQIADALRKAGYSVEFLANNGGGCPDLLVGGYYQNFLLEVKNPEKPKADRELTPAQKKWHSAWKGRVFVVETAEHALLVLDEYDREKEIANLVYHLMQAHRCTRDHYEADTKSKVKRKRIETIEQALEELAR